MDLTVELYDSREKKEKINLSHIEIRAFSPIAFDRWGFPTRVTHEEEIYRYFDFYGVTEDCYAYFVRDFFSQTTATLTSFTSAEADLIRRVSDQAAELVRSRIGQERRPINGLLAQIGLFRIIMAATGAFGQPGVSVFEIGPGSGYLGALLVAAGQRYASTDITQGFYLWQNRFLRGLAGDRLHEWAENGPPEDPGRFQVNHIPWWEYLALRKTPRLKADVVVSNAVLCEMTSDALRYTARAARDMLSGSPIGMVLYGAIGWEQETNHADVKRAFIEAGFKPVANRLFSAFLLEENEVPPAFNDLSNDIPLFGEGPASFDALDILALGEPGDRKLSPEIDFLSYIGVFTPPQRCLTLTDRDRDFFARVPYPYSAQDFARKIMVARRAAANRLKPGRICVYPLGDQTKAILDVLESRNDIQIAAILDQKAKPGSRFNGHTLLAPEQGASDALSDVDYILISHQNEATFLSELHRLGVPDSKIATIHLEAERSGWPKEAEEVEYINIMTSAWRSSLYNYGRSF